MNTSDLCPRSGACECGPNHCAAGKTPRPQQSFSSESTSHVASSLKALAVSKDANRYQYDKPDAGLLERFTNPMRLLVPDGQVYVQGQRIVEIEAPEFTSLCPLTGQPDFASIVIFYEPDAWCVESKALKLYLGSFRNHGEFHEACTARIAKDLWELLDPISLYVVGQYTPRGGIKFWPRVELVRPGHEKHSKS